MAKLKIFNKSPEKKAIQTLEKSNLAYREEHDLWTTVPFPSMSTLVDLQNERKELEKEKERKEKEAQERRQQEAKERRQHEANERRQPEVQTLPNNSSTTNDTDNRSTLLNDFTLRHAITTTAVAGAGCIIVPALASAVGAVAVAGAGVATVAGATMVVCRGIEGLEYCANLEAGEMAARDNRMAIQGPEQNRQRRYIEDNGRGPPRAIQGPKQKQHIGWK